MKVSWPAIVFPVRGAKRRSVLVWAIAASMLFHGALAALPALPAGIAALSPAAVRERLTAMLAPVLPDPGVVVDRDPVQTPMMSALDPGRAAPTPPPESTAPIRPEPAASTGDHFRGAVQVEEMTNHDRLGEWIQASVSADFPTEVDEPVRIGTPLKVRYPPRALRSLREDTVVVWLIVNDAGGVDEIHVVEGTPEFVEAVAATLSKARFRPAENMHQTVRFPIALEFKFRIDGANRSPATTAATREAR